MQAVNNSILLRMNSLPDLKVGKEKGKGEIQINVEEKPDDVEKADLLSTVAKLHINRTSSARNPKTKHVVSFLFSPTNTIGFKTSIQVFRRRRSSLPEELELTRQFLALNKKVINKGDSFHQSKSTYHQRKERLSPNLGNFDIKKTTKMN